MTKNRQLRKNPLRSQLKQPDWHAWHGHSGGGRGKLDHGESHTGLSNKAGSTTTCASNPWTGQTFFNKRGWLFGSGDFVLLRAVFSLGENRRLAKEYRFRDYQGWLSKYVGWVIF
jgi:hypothetical protein